MIETISIIALGFLAMGLAALVNPVRFVLVFDGDASTANARNEVRAVYGGFGVCTAALLLLVISPLQAIQQGVLVAVGVALAGMVLGRLISALLERPGPRMWAACALEALAAAALLYLGLFQG